MQAVIIGAGKLGQAIASLLREGGASSSCWDIDPAKVPGQKPLSESIPGADLVFLCVPSWTTRAAITDLLPFLRSGCPLVSFSKGIEAPSLKTMPELLPELAPGRPFAVVGGPMLADEILADKAAIGIVGCADDAFAKVLSDLFSSPRFRVEVSSDAFSVSLAGVLKNVYAVSLGIADGLGLSSNEKGWLVSRAIGEMVDISTALGADTKIILGAAGVGDFIATGYSPHSRNRQVGDEIVKTGACQLPGEGLVSLPQLVSRLGGAAAKFPLLDLVRTVGIDCQPAAPAFKNFFHGQAG